MDEEIKYKRSNANKNEKIFEVRKIQLTGGCTYLISLPKQWVKKIKLDAGDQVAIFESDIYEGSLVINPQYVETDRIKEITIKIIDDKGFDLSREILAKYLYGYDLINIESDQNISRDQREEIKKITQRLIGIEIVEESSKVIKVQCLISPIALPVEKTIDRIFLIVSQMLKDAVHAIITNDIELAKNVGDRDDEVDRLYFLCVRQLRSSIQDAIIAKYSKITPLECLDYRVIAKAIENAGDHIVEISRIYKNVIAANNIKLPDNVKTKLSKLSSMIFNLMNKAKKVMKSHSMELAHEVIEPDRGLIKEESENLKIIINSQKTENWTLPIDTILDLLIKISDIAGVDIADLVMG